jgi:hypothetical protein
MMFGDEDFNNSAVDLDRVRKLAGLPDNTGYDLPADEYHADDDFELGLDDTDDSLGLDAGMGDVSAPVGLDAELPMGDDLGDVSAMAPREEPNHWTIMLDELEKQMPDIPVGDFRDVIDALRRLANYAEDIRRSLVTENRKSLRDYMAEDAGGSVGSVGSTGSTAQPAQTAQLAKTPGGKKETIGNNRQDAIKAIHARMGGNPADLTKAQKVFAGLQRSGKIRASGSAFTMDPMDDDTFAASINDPMLSQ